MRENITIQDFIDAIHEVGIDTSHSLNSIGSAYHNGRSFFTIHHGEKLKGLDDVLYIDCHKREGSVDK